MPINLPALSVILSLISIGISVPQEYLPSSKHITTGLFDIATTPFTSSSVSTIYSVPFSGYTRSSNNFKVGFSLHSIDIKFSNLKLQFDLRIESTSMSGFQIQFSSSQANLVSFMKICYITKDPSYTQIFYIDTYRHSASPFLVGNDSTSSANKTFNFPLTAALPTGSLPNIIQKLFLNAWNINSTITGTDNHIDIFPTCYFPNENTITIKLQTSRSVIEVFFYSVTVVYFQSTLPYVRPLTSEIQPGALTQYFIDYKSALAPGANLLSINSPLTMFDYNTMSGMKSFHARTYQAVNFLNFRTRLPSDTLITYPSLNTQGMEYMKFELLVFYQKVCPSTEPYLVLYLTDCVISCPVGYVSDTENNCIADLTIKLDYVVKLPQSNKIQLLFSLEPNEASYNTLYTQINWTNAITTDIQTTSTSVEYMPSPDPKLKLTLEYAQDIEAKDKTVTILRYDPSNYPINFKGFQEKTITLSSMTSINNLAIKNYSDSSYQMGRIMSYISMALSGLYMITFLAGFAMGKVYILQMAFVPQVTFLSLIRLNNISPSMAGLGFLKYVFGYSLVQFTTDLNIDQTIGQSQNYMTLMGVSTHFIYNYNVMFAFNIIAFVLFVVFYIKAQKTQKDDQKKSQQGYISQNKAYQFFVFDTFLYLVLWFGVWIIFTGQIQISTMIKASTQNTILDIIGITFFCLNLILYLGYLMLYIKKFSRMNTFQQCLKDKNAYEEQNETKKKYFYVIYFVEKLVIASIFAFFNSLKFVNCIILGLHVVLIILVIVFRPYKITDQQNSSDSEQQSTMKPVIRPITNYSISIIIQILFFITNQIQSSNFVVYVPLIILCLLLLQLVVTVIFLVKDQIIKKDIAYLKKLCMGLEDEKQNHFSQVANQTPRKKIDPNQIKIQLLNKNTSNNLGQKASHMGLINYPNQKAFDKRQQKSDDTGQKKNVRSEALQVDYQNYFQQLNQAKNARQNLSIDQMLEIMAQNNHMRQLQQSKAQSAAKMIQQAQKMLEKVKKKKQFFESQNKFGKKSQKKAAQPFKLKSEWQNLQVVDSSRMDKLIEFDKKRKEQNLMRNL